MKQYFLISNLLLCASVLSAKVTEYSLEIAEGEVQLGAQSVSGMTEWGKT